MHRTVLGEALPLDLVLLPLPLLAQYAPRAHTSNTCFCTFRIGNYI